MTGLVSEYDNSGVPVGLCNASKLYYVTTAGGPLDVRFGFDYIKALAQECFGIKEVELVKVELLDIKGVDVEARMNDAIQELEAQINGYQK